MPTPGVLAPPVVQLQSIHSPSTAAAHLAGPNMFGSRLEQRVVVLSCRCGAQKPAIGQRPRGPHLELRQWGGKWRRLLTALPT